MSTFENRRRIEQLFNRVRRAAEEERAAALAATADRRRRIREAVRRAERHRGDPWLEELLAAAHAEENAERRARDARLAAARASVRPKQAANAGAPAGTGRPPRDRKRLDRVLSRYCDDDATRARAVNDLASARVGSVVKLATTHEVTVNEDGGYSIHRLNRTRGPAETKAYASTWSKK